MGCLHFLFVSSADHLLPLLIFTFFQQAPRLQLFSVRWFLQCFSLSSSILACKFLLPPFLHHAALCLDLPEVQHVLFSPLPPVLALCSFSCHCRSVMSSFLPDLHLCHRCHVDIFFHSSSDPFQSFICPCLFLSRRLATQDSCFWLSGLMQRCR